MWVLQASTPTDASKHVLMPCKFGLMISSADDDRLLLYDDNGNACNMWVTRDNDARKKLVKTENSL